MSKAECVRLNKEIKSCGLVKLTWGNVSLREGHKMLIKPSGVPFNILSPEDIAVVDVETGEHLEGKKPSVDTDIHLELYRGFGEIKSIIHTHSKYATAWAQAEKSIPCIGTTHADYFSGPIPVMVNLKDYEIKENYEKNIGKSVVQYFIGNKQSPLEKGAVLLPKHGVLAFGKTGATALENAIVLEEVAELATLSYTINSELKLEEEHRVLFEKHYKRKHGENKYYGQ
ncbi:L-ribulose-5-phosphate 4-epimerase [Candidatus Pacearchaeota archaeon]|nr:L-ribulose-5-phosphate 4-epimerase [Candidatus Pacearchaeota archaeon]|tara:strand:- start:985 stop:1668 length:684 start_codon:yes stop_codon:yes gene_type:complete